MGAFAIPAILGGGAILGGFLGSRRTPEEKAATQSQTDLTNLLGSIAGQQFETTFPGLQSSVGFYQALIGAPPPAADFRPGGFGTTVGQGVIPETAPSPSRGTLANVLRFPGGTNPLGVIPGLFGRGQREAGQIVPTQNAVTAEFGRIIDIVNQRRSEGTLTTADLDAARNAISSINDQFSQFVEPFGRAGPGGQADISGLTTNILASFDEITGLPTGEAGSRQSQRQAIEQVLGVPIQQLTDQFASARQNIIDSLPGGGQRDLALARLEQDKARTLGQLFLQAPQDAANALANIALGFAPTTVNALQSALGGALGTGQLEAERRQQGFATGIGAGQLLSQLFFPRGQTGGGGGGSSGFSDIPMFASQLFGRP